MTTTRDRIPLLVLALLAALPLARASAGGEPYRAGSGTAFTKPDGWTVTEDAGSIRAEDGQGRRVIFREIPAELAGPSAVSTMARVETEAKKQAKDLKIADLEQSPDAKSCRYRKRARVAGTPTDGYVYLTLRGGRPFMAGVESPSKSFDQDFPMLLEIVKTASIPAASAGATPTLDTLFVGKQGEDEVSWIAVPPDWPVAGNGMAMSAESPDRSMIVLTRTFSATTGEENAEGYLRKVVMERGGSNIEILKAGPDIEIINALRQNNAEGTAVQFFITFTGRDGAMKGYFSVTEIPLGFGVTFGGAAPPDLFDRNYPFIIAMARSVQSTAEIALSRRRDISGRLFAAARSGGGTGDEVIDTIAASAAGGGAATLPATVDPATASDPRDGDGAFTPAPGKAGKGKGRFVDPASLVEG